MGNLWGQLGKEPCRPQGLSVSRGTQTCPTAAFSAEREGSPTRHGLEREISPRSVVAEELTLQMNTSRLPHRQDTWVDCPQGLEG